MDICFSVKDVPHKMKVNETKNINYYIQKIVCPIDILCLGQILKVSSDSFLISTDFSLQKETQH